MDDLSRRDTMSFETDTDYDYEDMYCDNPPQEDEIGRASCRERVFRAV